MSIRGKVAAAALVCAAGIAGVILLWPEPDAAPAQPTSDEIKAAAQARLDASLKAGRTARQAMEETGKWPSEELCQAVWDRKSASDRRTLRYAMWMHGCADDATP
ncbi:MULTISPECIES: hypothetical protein [unclassified Streptomyces]|uniref:hypothetical protein n=1 Tax=unclassified Streptomyces TaxID=2593676 RepID=UPI002E7FCEAD|nr:hypothetical protein [Streptomyces sp. NBC_00589]WTI37475.1 hypothetical protein OIC96_21880 [Streptomyces sp. NBC_00775]WUB28847.1 hypothetical protein OHA51_27855 [Streptomyces sp. NBC_00589]